MIDTFVPLVSASAPSSKREPAFSSLAAKSNSTNSAKTPSENASTPAGGSASAACAKPVVTVQRTGDIVTSIRVQCGCGEVIDLSCIY